MYHGTSLLSGENFSLGSLAGNHRIDWKRAISAAACPSNPVPMGIVDDIGLSALEERVLAPARLQA